MPTNKKIAAVFRAAKANLTTTLDECLGKNDFICSAISHLYWSGNANKIIEARGAAKAIIRERMGGVYTLEAWLYNKGYITSNSMSNEIQAYRHRWLASLIKEYESKKG